MEVLSATLGICEILARDATLILTGARLTSQLYDLTMASQRKKEVHMKKFGHATVVGAVAMCLTLSACSTKGSTTKSGSGSGDVKTDIGVSDKEITLGLQTDLSGVFKEIGLGLTNGTRIWVDDINGKGGICGRQLKLDVADNGYDAAKAVTLYAQAKTNVAAMVQMLGSPVIAALSGQLVADNMLTIPASQSNTTLKLPVMRMVGSTYDIEMINALSYVQGLGKIKDGDKLGHIYIKGEYGDSGYAASTYYAKKHNQTIVPIQVAATDADMSAAITKLKSEGVKAVLLTTTGAQLGSAATTMAAQGMGDLPIVGNNPTYATTLLKGPAAAALGNYYRGISANSYASDVPILKEIAKKYEAKYTDTVNDDIGIGYAFGLVMGAALSKACDNKDMTRAGIVKASENLKVDTKGITAPLDYSKPGVPSTRETVVEQIDPSVPGGVKVVQELKASQDAKDYTPVG